MYAAPLTQADTANAVPVVMHQVYRRRDGMGYTVHTGTWSECMDWMSAHRSDGVNYYLRDVKS